MKSKLLEEVYTVNKEIGALVKIVITDCKAKSDLINNLIPTTIFDIKELNEKTTEKMLTLNDLWHYKADRTPLTALAAVALK